MQTRDNLDTLIGATFDVNNPIMYNECKAAASRERLRLIGDNGEMRMADSSRRIPEANITKNLQIEALTSALPHARIGVVSV